MKHVIGTPVFPADYKNRAAQRRMFKRTHAGSKVPAHIKRSDSHRKFNARKKAR